MPKAAQSMQRGLTHLKGFGSFWRRYRRNRAAVAGLGILGFMLFIALFAGLLTSNDPTLITMSNLQPPSQEHPMGTDDLGRDVLTGVIYGSRLSLIVGFCCSAVSLIVGVLIGCVSGYCGGRVDDILMRITEMVMTMPRVLVALVVIAMMRTTSITYIIFIISILSWTTTARLVRADILSLKGREFVEAARGLGAGSLRILFGEILPNVMPVVVVNSTFEISSAIATEAGLGFLGLSDPRAVSWGHMLSNSQRYLRAAWWMATFPGAALFLTMLALNSVGDGLNDALNPKLRER